MRKITCAMVCTYLILGYANHILAKLRVFSLLKQPAHRNVQAVLCSFTVCAGVLLPAFATAN